MNSEYSGTIKCPAGTQCVSYHPLAPESEIVEWTFLNRTHDVWIRLKHSSASGPASTELTSLHCKAYEAPLAGVCLLPTQSGGNLIVYVDNSSAYLYEASVTFTLKVMSDRALAVEDGHKEAAPAKSDLERNERVIRELLSKCPPGAVMSPGVVVPGASLTSARIDASDTVLANVAGEFGVGLFFLNRFAASEGFFARQSDRIPLFALGQSTLAYMRAILTWRRSDVDKAITMLHAAHQVAKDASPVAGEGEGVVGSLMWLVGATDDGTAAYKGSSKPLARAGTEIESLLVRAETSLILAAMYLMQETAVGILRAGLSVRSAYLFYKEAEAKLVKVTSQAGLDDLKYAWADASSAEGAAEDDDDLGDLPHAKDDIISILTGAVSAADGAEGARIRSGGLGSGAPRDIESAMACDSKAGSPAVGAATGGSSAAPSKSDSAPRSSEEATGLRSAVDHFERLERAVEAGERMGLSRSVASGISFGLGVFNIFASAMPPIVLRLVDLLGYPHDRKLGLRLLRRTVRAGGVRSPLAALVILIAEVLIPGFLPPSARTRLKEAEHIMAHVLYMYPSSVIFLWLGGRLLRMLGRPEDAQSVFEMISNRGGTTKSARSADQGIGSAGKGAASGGAAAGPGDSAGPVPDEPLPKQLEHVVLYESGLCNMSLLRFSEASAYFDRLSKENTWSRAFYQHMKIVCALGMGKVNQAATELAPAVEGLLERKLGGKLISAEQYAQKRASELVEAQGMRARPDGQGFGGSVWSQPVADSVSPERGIHPGCTMAALELLYLWNAFGQVSRSMQLRYLSVIDSYLLHLLCGDAANRALEAGGVLYGTSSSSLGAKPSDGSSVAAGIAKGEYQPVAASTVLEFVLAALSGSTCGPEALAAFTGSAGPRAPGASKAVHAAIERACGRRLVSVAFVSDLAVALLLRGAVLGLLGHEVDAEACLLGVVGLEGRASRDSFAIPYAHYELACLASRGPDACAQSLGRATGFAKDYNFSMRLKFRAHLLKTFGSGAH